MSMAEQIFSLCFISLMQLELIKDTIKMKSQNEIKILLFLGWLKSKVDKINYFKLCKIIDNLEPSKYLILKIFLNILSLYEENIIVHWILIHDPKQLSNP